MAKEIDIEKDELGEEKEPKETMVPLERFNEIYGKYKDLERSAAEFKEFGDTKGLREKLSKLQEWEKAVDDWQKEQEKSPDEKTESLRIAQIRKELTKVMPEIDALKKIEVLERELAELKGQSAEDSASEILAEHSKAFTDVLKEARIDLKYQTKIEEYLVSQMSEKEAQAFLDGDFSIAKSIFQKDLESGLLSVFVKRGAPVIPPLRNPEGGKELKPEKKPKTLKEVEDEAWARLNTGE